jgi:hypothetical protein
MLFLVTLHYKMRGRPAQARALPEPGPKTEARHVPWDGQGQDFLGPKNSNFFWPGPNPARPVKCSGLVASSDWEGAEHLAAAVNSPELKSAPDKSRDSTRGLPANILIADQ